MIKKSATRSWTFTFTDASCPITVQPAVVVTPVCGPADNDAITPTPVTGITYTVSSAWSATNTKTVTATADAGYTIGATDGWTVSADGTSATFTVTDAHTACPPTPVTPAVTVTDVCGSQNNDTINPTAVTGIGYTVSEWTGDSATVTATAAAGYVLTPATGWTLSEDAMTATYTVTDAHTACPSPASVTPAVSVTVVCGTVNNDTISTTDVPGQVTYSMSDWSASNTKTVTATPAGGHVIAPTAGWVVQNDGTATYTVTDTHTSCPVTPGTPTGPGGSVAGNQTPVTTPTPSPAPAAAKLTVQKTGPARARLGMNIVYTIRVRNTGDGAANSLVLVDRIPAGMVVVSKPKTAQIVKRSVRWNARSLAPGQMMVVRVVMRSTGTKAVRRCNTAVASATNATSAQAQACTNFSRVAGAVHVPRVTG